MAANFSALNIPVVSSFDGTAATTMSASCIAAFKSEKATTASAPGDGVVADLRTAVTRMLNGASSRATSWLMGP